VVYCRSGGMSVQVAAMLAAAGYTKIYELKGGFNAWKTAGHDLLNK
jgi:rhodanese-related sulfurtransferase